LRDKGRGREGGRKNDENCWGGVSRIQISREEEEGEEEEKEKGERGVSATGRGNCDSAALIVVSTTIRARRRRSGRKRKGGLGGGRHSQGQQ